MRSASLGGNRIFQRLAGQLCDATFQQGRRFGIVAHGQEMRGEIEIRLREARRIFAQLPQPAMNPRVQPHGPGFGPGLFEGATERQARLGAELEARPQLRRRLGVQRGELLLGRHRAKRVPRVRRQHAAHHRARHVAAPLAPPRQLPRRGP